MTVMLKSEHRCPVCAGLKIVRIHDRIKVCSLSEHMKLHPEAPVENVYCADCGITFEPAVMNLRRK